MEQCYKKVCEFSRWVTIAGNGEKSLRRKRFGPIQDVKWLRNVKSNYGEDIKDTTSRQYLKV